MMEKYVEGPEYLVKSSGESRLSFYGRLLCRYFRERGNAYDIQALIWPVALLMVLFRNVRGHSIIYEAHDDPYSEKMIYRPMWVRKILFRRADTVVAHSRYATERCREFGCKDVEYIPFGPLIEHVERIPREKARAELGVEESNVLLFYALIQPHKGLDSLIRAFADVVEEEPDSRLFVVGRPEEDVTKYETLISELDLDDHVTTIFEDVSVDEAKTYFGASDVVVLPYREVTQSSVPFVAYMYERPVIASDVGAFSELVVPGETGYLCQPDSQQLVECISEALSSKDELEEYGRRGRNRITSGEFSWERITRDYNSLFNAQVPKTGSDGSE